MKDAPLFVDTYDLHRWILDRFDGDTDQQSTREALLSASRGLLEAVTLGLQRFDAIERAELADEGAALLRLHLRLARDQGLIDDRQLLFATKALVGIGRQIGGWRRHLEKL